MNEASKQEMPRTIAWVGATDGHVRLLKIDGQRTCVHCGNFGCHQVGWRVRDVERAVSGHQAVVVVHVTEAEHVANADRVETANLKEGR